MAKSCCAQTQCKRSRFTSYAMVAVNLEGWGGETDASGRHYIIRPTRRLGPPATAQQPRTIAMQPAILDPHLHSCTLISPVDVSKHLGDASSNGDRHQVQRLRRCSQEGTGTAYAVTLDAHAGEMTE